jgi:hypothetical protein
MISLQFNQVGFAERGQHPRFGFDPLLCSQRAKDPGVVSGAGGRFKGRAINRRCHEARS